MTQYQQPRLPIPPPLMMSEIGSFAYNTLTQRWPAIGRRAIAENDFSPEIVENLETLVREIPDKLVRAIADPDAPDIAAWDKYLEPYEGKRWLDIPWYFGEAYFYRRMLEATHYFQPGQWEGVDPFEYQKRLGLKISWSSIQTVSKRVNQLHGSRDKTGAIDMLYLALWGNRADLSLWSAESGDRSRTDVDQEQAHILADDAPLLADRLANCHGMRIDFIVDNAGFELFSDLCLVDFLLGSKIAGVVCLHLKAHPTFVSDAVIKDVQNTIEVLAAEGDEEVKAIARRLQDYMAGDRLRLYEDLFWTSPLVFWEMPENLRQQLGEANLIVVKGDANYRRLLGDRDWEFTTPFADITCYFPAPMVALRTLKAELAAGLQQGQPEKLSSEDPEWLTNGRWGVIQMNQ